MYYTCNISRLQGQQNKRMERILCQHFEYQEGNNCNEAVVCKPLLAVVKGLKSAADFNKDSLDSHELEVISGKHRRVVMQKLLNETKAEKYKYTSAVLFCGKLSLCYSEDT